MRLGYGLAITLTALMITGLAGCSSETPPTAPENVSVDEQDHAGHNHSGWWCSERGVPEEECALCDTSLVADFKANGDWCDEHNRPDSQCLTCNPANFDQFAARYEAKFGERPPQPTE